MALVIRTTGLEQYAPGGEARLKLLIIGGPGVGKTRFASYFPRPIYADCEAGLASVADRNVPYVSVNSSIDMLDLLTHLKLECRLPKDKRTYDTIVIDTLDAYQRKLKNEWMEKEKKETFTGWEAWGFVGQKMSLLLTRLLNLDMNVIVNVHYKDKTTKDDDTGKETHELMLQLQGEISDTAFNDFDQVGWMGTYWEAVSGERVQKRGLTFKPTPDKPFLKDRLHVTPTWMEIEFADSDYENLFSRVADRLSELAPTETVGEIPSADLDNVTPATVVRPEDVASGALPPQKSAELTLAQMDKPALLKRARDLGISKLPDGTPIKRNPLKAEMIAALEHHQLTTSAEPVTVGEVIQKVIEVADENLKLMATEPAFVGPDKAAERVAQLKAKVPKQGSAPDIEQVSEGLVDKKTGELVTEEQAIATVEDKLGGQVIAQTVEPAPEVPKTPAASEALARHTTPKPAATAVCEKCGKDLTGERSDYVKLAWIKYRKKLCEIDYQALKSGA